MQNPLPSPDVLRQLLRYEPDTGKLFWRERPLSFFKSEREWKRWNGRYSGRPAFRVNPQGYVSGMIFRQMHRAHRLVWAMCYNEWPSADIDHINGDRSDNRLCNLRVVSRRENALNQCRRKNNKSGQTGVSQCGNGKWRAYISRGGKPVHLGVYDTIDQAREARKRAEVLYGYHANHGAR